MRLVLLAAALVATPALAETPMAETPMTGAEFDAYATGKTLDYFENGEAFGREVYLPGRKVRWAFTADECKMGTWYPQGDQICFLYEDDPDPKCWRIWQRGGGLAASFATDMPDTPPREVKQTDEPLACPGPDVGV